MRAIVLFLLGSLILLAVGLAGINLQSADAEGNANTVLEITESGSPVVVYASDNTNSSELETLFWGDRALWTGEEYYTQSGDHWVQLILGNGRLGWAVLADSDVTAPNAFYTTVGFQVGTVAEVLPEGSGAHLRLEPSTYVDRVAQVSTGDQLTIVDGPYQAEYQMWWKMQNANGQQGWIIDIPGWLVAIN